jgi:hypothetical protein
MQKHEENWTTGSAARGLSRTRISPALTRLNEWGWRSASFGDRMAGPITKLPERVFQSCFCQRIIRARLKPGAKVSPAVTF